MDIIIGEEHLEKYRQNLEALRQYFPEHPDIHTLYYQIYMQRMRGIELAYIVRRQTLWDINRT